MALASRDDLCFVALSLVSMSIYLPVGHVFLGMEGAKAVRQCHQNDLVHKMCIFFVLYLTKLCPSTLFLQKQSPARVIPRIIPDTYPESYPNLALLCDGPVGPFRKQPQPAWCRREPFDIGYSLYVDSKEGGANHTPNHTSETYFESYLRIIPPMQHAWLTPEFSNTAIYVTIDIYILYIEGCFFAWYSLVPFILRDTCLVLFLGVAAIQKYPLEGRILHYRMWWFAIPS